MRISDWSSDVCSSDLVNQTIASAQQFADASVRCRHQMQIVSLLATRIASFFRIAGMVQCLALSRWAVSFDPRRPAPICSHREFEGVHACHTTALLYFVDDAVDDMAAVFSLLRTGCAARAVLISTDRIFG